MSNSIRIKAAGTVLACAAALLAAAAARAEATPTPPPRLTPAMAHDPATGNVVLFGGGLFFGPGGLTDTWTWDGAAWTAAEGASPPGTQAPLMAYDAVNAKVLLATAGNGGATVPMQTWSFDGRTRTWAQEASAVNPPNRTGGAMAADAATGSVVLFGGRGVANLLDLDDTWIWDGATKVWVRQAPATSPPADSLATMAYDPVSRLVVLFGRHGQTWTWNGVTKAWTREAVDGGPPLALRPAMAFHGPSQKLVLYDGDDTWLWDGATRRWTQATPLVRPSPREYTAMAAGDGNAVLFGGLATFQRGLLDDTWLWDGRSWARSGESVGGPVVAVGDATVVEGNAGTRNAVFSVTLSAPSPSPVTVDYRTVDVTASSIPRDGPSGDDFQSRSGTLTFAPGVTALNIKVPVNGDFDAPAFGGEFDEELFWLQLSGATGATIGDDSGLGVVVEDDPQPPQASVQLGVGDLAIYEGNSGARGAVFNVSLSGPTLKTVTVAYTTVVGTTKANDFTARSGTVTFAPGTTSQAIKVPITPDTKVEPDETFTVRLSDPSTGVVLDRALGTGTIVGDDM